MKICELRLKISLNIMLKCPINNIAALVQIIAWHRPGDKPWSQPKMVSLLVHICVTRSQMSWPWLDDISGCGLSKCHHLNEYSLFTKIRAKCACICVLNQYRDRVRETPHHFYRMALRGTKTSLPKEKIRRTDKETFKDLYRCLLWTK